MKKSILTLACTALMIGAVVVSCQSPAKKEETAKDNLQKAQEDLDEVQYDAAMAAEKKAAIAKEWRTLKDNTQATINENEIRIAELKVKMKKTGKDIDSLYAKKIDALEQKNKDIKTRIETYKEDKNSDWESFKREYNHDMEELGKALKDITVDNKK
jgi:septal ring factor EnvC (AmiA/AmiB activator)